MGSKRAARRAGQRHARPAVSASTAVTLASTTAGNTIILVTHEADIAGHAHREVFLLDGRVERDQVRTARATASSPGTSAL